MEFVGHHLLDYVAQVLGKHYAVDPRDLHAGCRELFRRHFPDVSGWFPRETTYYFSDEPQPENGYALVDTRQTPTWR